MMYKGKVSSFNLESNKARILIPEINYLTNECPIASQAGEVQINDDVMVAFLGNSLADGIIVTNLSRSYTPGVIQEIDGGSFI